MTTQSSNPTESCEAELGLAPGGAIGGSSPVPACQQVRQRRPIVLTLLSVVFGIVLPVAAISLKGLCADALFDPAPTIFHICVLASVPLYHVLVLVIAPEKHRRLQLDLFGAMTIGVALVYAAIFAPIAPLALMAIVAGIGLLPLAPYGALAMSIVAQLRIYRRNPGALARRWYSRSAYRTVFGVALGILLLVGADLPTLATEHAMALANDPDPARAAEGIAWLRRWGDREVMLRAADDLGRRRAELVPELYPVERVSSTQAKLTYYRASGTSADAELARNAAASESRPWNDPQRGSSQIGTVNPRLELVASRLDGSINADAAVGYAEWTLVFRNTASSGEAEARARIALPPGAVVSRATLWIEGEPREAVFGGSAETRSAYQSVVSARRDPLLITAAGPGLVQLQCFPIAAGGSEMKVLMGVTFPLELERIDVGSFSVPRLVARNFALSRGLQHRVWIESKRQLSVVNQGVVQNATGAYVLDAPMNQALLGECAPEIRAHRSGALDAWVELPQPNTATELAVRAKPSRGTEARADVVPATHSALPSPAADAAAADEPTNARPALAALVREVPAPSVGAGTNAHAHSIIEQRWGKAVAERPKRIAIVVDTSFGMGPGLESLADALPTLRLAPEMRVLLATDGGHRELALRSTNDVAAVQLALRALDPVGGIDNNSALETAAAWARGVANGVVLWVHGPQPVALGTLDTVKQSLERSSMRFITAQAFPGEHVGLRELGRPVGVEALPRHGSFEADLRRQFSRWSGVAPEWIATRTERSVSELPTTPPSTIHIARLWAYDEVERTRRDSPDKARELAIAQRLVTPVSGAVVLENSAQYVAAGLESTGELSSTPSVPEPETWAMLALALGFVSWQLHRHGRRWNGWRLA